MKRFVLVAYAILATSLAFWLVLSSVADRQPSSEVELRAAAEAEALSFESGIASSAAWLDTTTLHNLRHRRLPGEDYSNFTFDPSSAEAGFAVGFLFFIILALLLCCCLCGGGRGGGRGCSLCDILAIVCLWELCCDREGGGMMDNGFNML
jgi:hypothetical protein